MPETVQTRTGPTAYQLRITLIDSEPEVWRQVLVPIRNSSLADLHVIVQQVMGWENLHDYCFQLGIGTEPCPVETPLAEILGKLREKPLYYSYDQQCGWLHRITVDALEVATEGGQGTFPKCIDGASACPPEGSGGVWGYDEWLARLENPDDPEYLDLLDKYGDFDPDVFDISAANKRLSSGIQPPG